mgnify:CR=1 FL=1
MSLASPQRSLSRAPGPLTRHARRSHGTNGTPRRSPLHCLAHRAPRAIPLDESASTAFAPLPQTSPAPHLQRRLLDSNAGAANPQLQRRSPDLSRTRSAQRARTRNALLPADSGEQSDAVRARATELRQLVRGPFDEASKPGLQRSERAKRLRRSARARCG